MGVTFIPSIWWYLSKLQILKGTFIFELLQYKFLSYHMLQLNKTYSKTSTDTTVYLIQDISLYLAYLHLFKIGFTFPVCRIPAARQTATIIQVMASPVTKLPWMLPNISNPGETPRTSPVKYFAELVTKMKGKHYIFSRKI